MANHKIIITGDGSHTLFVPDLDEHYHSTFGAIRESKHIFLEAGFKAVAGKFYRIEIFEAGFGTGLNAFLTQIEAEKMKIPVIYTAIEAYPLEKELWSTLNYPAEIDIPGCSSAFEWLHEASWNKPERISAYFTLKKINGLLEEFNFPRETYHLIYFDAFSPDIQPELWKKEIFERIYHSLVSGGMLVTYSVKGIVTRAMRSAGFRIEKLPGPPGKRNMLRAVKPLCLADKND